MPHQILHHSWLTMIRANPPYSSRYFSFQWKSPENFLLNKNICCGYSLEVPPWGTSNEYPQHMFSLRNKKNINIATYYLELYLELWSPKDSFLTSNYIFSGNNSRRHMALDKIHFPQPKSTMCLFCYLAMKTCCGYPPKLLTVP